MGCLYQVMLSFVVLHSSLVLHFYVVNNIGDCVWDAYTFDINVGMKISPTLMFKSFNIKT